MTKQKKPGPKSIYGPKEAPPRTHLHTRLAKRILAAASARCQTAESTIVEHLVRLYGGTLRPEEFAPLD